MRLEEIKIDDVIQDLILVQNNNPFSSDEISYFGVLPEGVHLSNSIPESGEMPVPAPSK